MTDLSGCDDLFDFFKKIFCLNASITKPALKGVAVNLIVKREYYYSPVSVFHFYVTAFSMNLNEA